MLSQVVVHRWLFTKQFSWLGEVVSWQFATRCENEYEFVYIFPSCVPMFGSGRGIGYGWDANGKTTFRCLLSMIKVNGRVKPRFCRMLFAVCSGARSSSKRVDSWAVWFRNTTDRRGLGRVVTALGTPFEAGFADGMPCVSRRRRGCDFHVPFLGRARRVPCRARYVEDMVAFQPEPFVCLNCHSCPPCFVALDTQQPLKRHPW